MEEGTFGKGYLGGIGKQTFMEYQQGTEDLIP
jgi:hypothetical protein